MDKILTDQRQAELEFIQDYLQIFLMTSSSTLMIKKTDIRTWFFSVLKNEMKIKPYEIKGKKTIHEKKGGRKKGRKGDENKQISNELPKTNRSSS